MAQGNRSEINLYADAKAGFKSLIKQTASVFVGFLILLLMTGGAPSGTVVSLSFCFGVAYVAWSEQTRLRNLRSSNCEELVEELTQENQKKRLSSSKLYALLIGINEYIDSRIPNLANSVYKVAEIKSILQLADTNYVEEVHELIGNEATKTNIMRHLWELAELATEKDTVLIYFSCHSARAAGAKKELFLLPTDSRIDHLAITGISKNDLEHVVVSMRSKETLLVLDAGIPSKNSENSSSQISEEVQKEMLDSLYQRQLELRLENTKFFGSGEQVSAYLRTH